MVTPRLPKGSSSTNSSVNKSQQSSAAQSSSSSSSSYYMVLIVKILLTVVILLWLPPLVTSKQRRSKRDNSGRTMVQRLHKKRSDCEVDCLEWSHRHEFPPEESMNCIFHCMSPTCFRQVYTQLLEPGEVDIQRYDLFEACAQEEIREARKQKAVEKKKR